MSLSSVADKLFVDHSFYEGYRGEGSPEGRASAEASSLPPCCSRLVPANGTSERDLQLRQHLEVALHLDKLGRDRMASRVRSCCRKGIRLACQCAPEFNGKPKKERRFMFVCDTRSCEPSAKRRFKRLSARYELLVKEMRWPKFISLGYRASPLLEFEGILQAFKRFRRLKEPTGQIDPKTGKMIYRHAWTQKVGMVCIEAKWNQDHWWLHLHILADGPWILIKQLTKDWEEATGQTSANVDVKRARTHGDLMRYLLGYTFKPMEAPPEKEAIFLSLAYKKHFLTIFGLTSKEMAELLVDSGPMICLDCGSKFMFDSFVDPPSRPDMGISVTGPPGSFHQY